MRNRLGFGTGVVMMGGCLSPVICFTVIDMSSLPLIKVNIEYLPCVVYPELICLSQVISINLVVQNKILQHIDVPTFPSQ
jgi:hypothetical protein